MMDNFETRQQSRYELIIAAIEVLSDIGIDSVTLRMINRRASHKNNSSLHYHFGGKDGLIRAVNEFIQGEFDRFREPSLLVLEESGKTGSVDTRAVVEAMVRPYVQVIEEHDWGFAAVRTIARMAFDGQPGVLGMLNRSAKPVMDRFLNLVSGALPHLSREECAIRLNYVLEATIHGFACSSNRASSYFGDLSAQSLSDLASFHVSVGEAVLSGCNLHDRTARAQKGP